jgi:membrane-bound lytic murein transglycosylase D
MIWKFLILILLTVSCVQTINKHDGIDMDEAEVLADKARKKTEFPIVLNTQVLHHLNAFIAKPSGRLHLRACFKRMEQFKKRISKEIKKQNLPVELMAIPVIESGYQNIHSAGGTGSGLWSLISSTAIAKGLTVNEKKDERLHIEKSTEVALEYLKSNYKMLKDWQLAILAYNMGESKVRLGVVETNSRDAWVLINKGFENDEGYLAKVMAVVIIMKNPDVLN